MKWSRHAYLAIIPVFILAFIFQSPQAKENSLKKGKWALQFEIDRDFDLSGFQGHTLSIKNHTADNRAYRLGITVALEVGDGESISTSSDSPRRPGSSDFNSRSLGINLQKIYFTDISAPVNLFYGLGVAASFAHSKRNIMYDYYYSDTIIDTRRETNVSDSWSGGVSGIIGGEWFFAKNMSLLGEYSTIVNYGGNTRKSEYQRYRNGQKISSSSNVEKSNSVRISSSAVKFGLSIYF